MRGHAEDRNVALEDLAFFSHEVKILGVYPAHPYRLHGDAAEKQAPDRPGIKEARRRAAPTGITYNEARRRAARTGIA